MSEQPRGENTQQYIDDNGNIISVPASRVEGILNGPPPGERGPNKLRYVGGDNSKFWFPNSEPYNPDRFTD